MKKRLNRRDFLGAVSVVGAGLAMGLPTIATASGGPEGFTNKPYWGKNNGRISKTIPSILREPLPAEDLNLFETAEKYVINGPTFRYRIDKITGAIKVIRVVHEGQEVISTSDAADIMIDRYQLFSRANSCRLEIVTNGKDKIVIRIVGILRDPEKLGPEVDYTVLHTFFNDGVVVSKVKLIPRADLKVKQAIVYRLPAKGRFNNYIHKRRDENGANAVRDKLPEPGKSIGLGTLTSCLGVYSPMAALSIFTDGGAIHLSRAGMETATLEVTGKEGSHSQVTMSQYIVHVASGDQSYLIKAGEEFSFRVGISLAPNRVPHSRTHDLRMFTWIGDEKYPYPTDQEITEVAHWGFTLFQMHRIGNPGEPRSPHGELERVIRKVHELGMLFIWEVNADLLVESAPGVQAMKAKGEWDLWQGFNYGGHYVPKMDPSFASVATCLASPNGLDEYRLANIDRMFDKFAVDGIYVDDNLAYANCTLWKEHGHPREVYDCLIELHEMNWRRRQLMRRRCPHMLLISHCTAAFILPVICDFDAQIYGEGYSFESPVSYWENFTAHTLNLNGQAMIWPGDDEPNRVSNSLAFNFDLLTGGGQYTQLDWRLFPEKFSYAAGVSTLETIYSKTYNLAQYFYGLYESQPFYFAESFELFSTKTPLTFASIYQNQVWNDWLIVVANMDPKNQITSLDFHSPKALGISPEKRYLLFNFHSRTTKTFRGDALNQGFADIPIPGQNLQLYFLREHFLNEAFHLWGGKRISETWEVKKRKLTFEIHGPAGLQDTVFVGGAELGFDKILVSGEDATFFFDPAQNLAYGTVRFTAKPLKVTVLCSSDRLNRLPEKAVIASPLALQSGLDF